MTIKTIQQGTNLTRMVAAYNREFNAKFTVAEIAKANGIKNPDKIQAGGKLIFPDKFELSAKQEPVRNAEGGKTVRNGVKESVDVSMGASTPVTTTPGQISTQVQSRPLEKLPEAPKSNAAKTQQPVTTTPGQISTQVQSRPLEKLPRSPAVKSEQPITTTPDQISTQVQSRPLEKLPRSPAVKSEQPITTTPGQISTQVQSRPLEKLPEAPKPNAVKSEQPISTTPGQISTQVQSRPLEKLPEPPAKTTLSLNEFLAANKGQKLSVDSLRRGGVDAAPSDLNGDGVIAGQKELTTLFGTAERADKNKDKTVADLTNGTVAKNFERIGSSQRLQAAPYSQLDLQRVQTTLKEGSAERLMTVNPENAKFLGLSPGSTELTISMPIDETRGLGNRNNNVTIYRDAKSGQYFKEYNNDADGKNTPMVPLTAAEFELVRNANRSEQLGGAKNANEQRMMTELFSFDGDV